MSLGRPCKHEGSTRSNNQGVVVDVSEIVLDSLKDESVINELLYEISQHKI